MATHDYVIDNSTGANVRTDLNNVLQAILTNNSSGSAPSTTAAYMLWADTSNNLLSLLLFTILITFSIILKVFFTIITSYINKNLFIS